MTSSTPKNLSRRRFLKRAGLVLAGTATYQALSRDWVHVNQHELRLPRWDADGVRVALLSDLHANSAHQARRAAHAIRLAIEQKPDLIAIPGDFVDRQNPDVLVNLQTVIDAAQDAKCPIFATLGNHDYWSLPAEIIRALKGSRIHLLRNQVVHQEGFLVAGVDDGIAGRDRHDFLTAKHDGKSLLALFHEPDFVDRLDPRASLMVAGHSHGGQVCLPMGISIHTPRGARRYIEGYYPKAEVPLFVTRGVGCIGPDVRVFCPPEVCVLTLRGG